MSVIYITFRIADVFLLSVCSTGGLSDVFRRTRGKYAQGFNGCIANLTLSGDYDVIELVRSADAVRNVNECVTMTTTGG